MEKNIIITLKFKQGMESENPIYNPRLFKHVLFKNTQTSWPSTVCNNTDLQGLCLQTASSLVEMYIRLINYVCHIEHCRQDLNSVYFVA